MPIHKNSNLVSRKSDFIFNPPRHILLDFSIEFTWKSSWHWFHSISAAVSLSCYASLVMHLNIFQYLVSKIYLWCNAECIIF